AEHDRRRDQALLAAVALRRECRRLAGARVVRVVGVGVEALQASLLERAQERDRADRRAEARRIVVAARCGGAAGDLLAAQHRQVDTGEDRLADLRVDGRTVRDPLALLPEVLRPEEDGVVWTVPR